MPRLRRTRSQLSALLSRVAGLAATTPIAQIAARERISVNYATKLARSMGCIVTIARVHTPAAKAARAAAIRHLLAQDITPKAIAQEIGVSYSYLMQKIHALGYRSMPVTAAERTQILASRRAALAASGHALAFTRGA